MAASTAPAVPMLPPRGHAFLYHGCGVEQAPWHGGKVDWIWGDTRAAAGVRGAAPLRIAYFIPHHNVTGGLKMIMKQIAHLKARGHWVQAAFRSPDPASPVLPPWAPVEVDSQRLLGMQESMTALLGPPHNVDVVLVGYFTQLLEFRGVVECPGPILYWDQGHEHVFGDPTSAPDWDVVWHAAMHLPLPYVSVSGVIRDTLAAHYLREAPVIPNAIDCNAFRPAEAPAEAAPKRTRGSGAGSARAALPRWAPLSEGALKRVLLVGNPGLKLKNFKAALDALNVAQRALRGVGHPGLSVTWICQVKPAVTGVTFPVSFAVNPPQGALPALYGGGHDAFLFTSVYEAWGMPVLEAMAAGLPVVAARCHGLDSFVRAGENALLADPYDHRGLGDALFRVLGDPALSATLSAAGRATAEALTWRNSMAALEVALYQVHHYLGSHSDAPGGASKLAAAVEAHNAAPAGTPLALPAASALQAAHAERLFARLTLLRSLRRAVVDAPVDAGMHPWTLPALVAAAPAASASGRPLQVGGLTVHLPAGAAVPGGASSPSADTAPLEAACSCMVDGVWLRCVAGRVGRRGPRVLPPDSPLALAVPKAKAYAGAVAVALAACAAEGATAPLHIAAPAGTLRDLRSLRDLGLTPPQAACLAPLRLDAAGAQGRAVAASDVPPGGTLAALVAALPASPSLAALHALASGAAPALAPAAAAPPAAALRLLPPAAGPSEVAPAPTPPWSAGQLPPAVPSTSPAAGTPPRPGAAAPATPAPRRLVPSAVTPWAGGLGQSPASPLAAWPPAWPSGAPVHPGPFPPVAAPALAALFATEAPLQALLGALGTPRPGPLAPLRVDGVVQGVPYLNSFTRQPGTGALLPVAVVLRGDPNATVPGAGAVSAPVPGAGTPPPHSAAAAPPTRSLAPAAVSAPLPGAGALRGDEALWRTLPDGTSDGLSSSEGRLVFHGGGSPSPARSRAGRLADAQAAGVSLAGAAALGAPPPGSEEEL